MPKKYDSQVVKEIGDIAGIMELILDIRDKLRKNKNFELADELRNKLADLNIEIKDTPEGPTWEQN